MPCTVLSPAAPTVLTGPVTAETTTPINSGKISVVPLTNATWTALPAVAAIGRQGLGIQNTSGDTVILNWSAAAPPTVGIVINTGSERYYSIKDTAVIYARMATVAAASVTIEELIL